MPRPTKGDEPLVNATFKLRPATKRTIKALAIILGRDVSQGEVIDQAIASMVAHLPADERRKLDQQLQILPE